MGYRVCGYSAGAALPEVWEFSILGAKCERPYEIQPASQFGIRWAGEIETLDRLILGASSRLTDALIAHGMPAEEASNFYLKFVQTAGDGLTLPAMPIQDAIDVARFLVETASRVARYGMRPETIGGPIELAAITKHEKFKWVARKHYYSAEYNRETDHE